MTLIEIEDVSQNWTYAHWCICQRYSLPGVETEEYEHDGHHWASSTEAATIACEHKKHYTEIANRLYRRYWPDTFMFTNLVSTWKVSFADFEALIAVFIYLADLVDTGVACTQYHLQNEIRCNS